MWYKTYSKKISNIKIAEIWSVWADVNQWGIWQDDLDYAKLSGKFAAGSKFTLKPKGVPEVTIELIKVEENKCFIDLTRFPFAKMYGEHQFIQINDNEVEIRTTVRVTGLLGFIWRKIVAQKIVDDEPKQIQNLIDRVLELRL